MDEYATTGVPDAEPMEEEEFERLYAAPAEVVVLLSIFYGGISVLAVVGNSLVIWVVATTRQMRTTTNLYIANLALADVIIGLFCIPFQFQAALLQRWNLPFFMCGFCPFVQALSVNVSVFTLTAIAVDRHRAIINPLRARPTKFASKAVIALIWLAAVGFAVPCAVAFRVELVQERIKEDDATIHNVTRPFCTNLNLSEQQLRTYRYALVLVQYVVPFCVISCVYGQMAVRLWGTRAPGNAQDSRDLALLKNKKKVIKMLLIVVVVFGLCWLPLQLYNVLYVTFPEVNEYHFISIVWFGCDWLAMSNSSCNPFIYGIYNDKFQREFRKRLGACCCRPRPGPKGPERTLSVHTRVSSLRSTCVPPAALRLHSTTFSASNSCRSSGSQRARSPRSDHQSPAGNGAPVAASGASGRELGGLAGLARLGRRARWATRARRARRDECTQQDLGRSQGGECAAEQAPILETGHGRTARPQQPPSKRLYPTTEGDGERLSVSPTDDRIAEEMDLLSAVGSAASSASAVAADCGWRTGRLTTTLTSPATVRGADEPEASAEAARRSS